MRVSLSKEKKKQILKNTVIAVVLFTSVFLAFYFGLSKTAYQRSNLATFSELLFRVGNNKEIYSDEKKFDRYIKKKQRENRALSALPWDFLNKKLNLSEYGGMKVIDLRPDASNPKVVIYIHGGTYISDISLYHLNYCEKLSRQLDINVMLPLYPLTPAYTYKDAYELLTDFYLSQLQREREIVIMGDSAGGGLAAGLCEYLFEQGYDVPRTVILFSPWLDVTMSNPEIPIYEKSDPLLACVGLKKAGLLWSDGDPLNYMASPVYGDLSAFSDVTLFVGTREVFYPDVQKFHGMLKEAGISTELYVGKGLNHIYTEYPIPEAGDAFDIVCKKIGGAET